MPFRSHTTPRHACFLQCSFYAYRGYKVIYRRYASLFFIVGVMGEEENELANLEFIHALVETLDRYFENVVSHQLHASCRRLQLHSWVHGERPPWPRFALICRANKRVCSRTLFQCELDIMFNLEKAHFILDEMVVNGCIIETNKNNVLAPIQLLDKAA